MEKKVRVKILETDFNEELNLVQWKIKMLEEKTEIVLAWRGSDLGHAMGIDVVIPPDLMRGFCKDIEGKEINLVMTPDMNQFEVEKFSKLSQIEMQNISNEMEKRYPFYEVEYLEKNKDKEND